MNFALRYQLAFSSYAVAALSQATPAYRTLYAQALRGAIEKMLHIDVWGYWRVPPDNPDSSSGSGHVAVLLSPHQRIPAGPPSDPIAHNNLQYSGHLSTMLGLYEKISGDPLYDSPFSLGDPSTGVQYTYTHSRVADRIHAQMQSTGFGGVCCEQGMAYVPCNNHAMASNTLHDALHDTNYRDANGPWLKTVRDKMVLRGPALRGVFGTAYVKDLHMAAPVAFNFTDAWGLAFMLPFDRPLVRKLYPRFKKRSITSAGSEAFVGSSPMSERMEISDVAINTGFGAILARGIGDLPLYDSLLRYATSAFGATWQDSRYLYKDAPRTLHATALFALAQAISPGGADFARLFNDPPGSLTTSLPSLVALADPAGRTGISQAEYDPQLRTLHLTLTQLAPTGSSTDLAPTTATLTISNTGPSPHVTLSTAPEPSFERTASGITFNVPVRPGEPTTCAITI
jgi:hypothetical protein